MALEKLFEATTGSKYNKAYFRIVQINCSWLTRNAKVVILIYKDKAARQADKNSVGQLNFSFDGDEGEMFDQLFSMAIFEKKKTNPLKICYEYIKSLEAFEGAKDV